MRETRSPSSSAAQGAMVGGGGLGSGSGRLVGGASGGVSNGALVEELAGAAAEHVGRVAMLYLDGQRHADQMRSLGITGGVERLPAVGDEAAATGGGEGQRTEETSMRANVLNRERKQNKLRLSLSLFLSVWSLCVCVCVDIDG